MSLSEDTIAALASGAGRAGVGVVRVSGPRVAEIAEPLIGGLPAPRRAVMRRFTDANGDTIDRGLAIYFAAPASYTGEPVLELQGHGSPVLLDRLLKRLIELGARVAGPGEFSERAFYNDKMSLVQAEAVADAINAASDAAATAAVRSLEGAFARRIDEIVARLTSLRAYTEGAIDFPDEEDVNFLDDGRIASELTEIRRDLGDVIRRARSGAVLRDGLNVVILGQPNVGKSSLLNALSQRDTAIVTDIAGTTRDVLDEQLVLGGLPVTIIDTAGLRDDSTDPIEIEGVRRARAAVDRADHVLYVVDSTLGLTATDRERIADLGDEVPVTLIFNKIDQRSDEAGYCQRDSRDVIALSATTGTGLAALIAHLRRVAGLDTAETATFIARRRHLDALDKAAVSIDSGQRALETEAAAELLADELRLAQRHLGEITGTMTNDALLGEIFSTFCIGK